MDERVVRPQFFGFVTFDDGAGMIATATVGHAKSQLSIKMSRVRVENGLQLSNGGFRRSLAKLEHCLIVLFLKVGHDNLQSI